MLMSQKHRRHPPEFRRRAVELLISGRSLHELARELDVGATTLWRWKEMYLHEAAATAPPKEDQRPADQVYQENQELRRRLKELETHHEILKKALGILSQPLPPGMP
jgi:transposase-like protein